ncbi:hypothetical protein NTGHW29_300028 [Candidatus Nitrotoga sp. HW29]|nr:hypothetical protein NTGHW29_300028 [Candidatus Nitrotoga sp. HW29]
MAAPRLDLNVYCASTLSSTGLIWLTLPAKKRATTSPACAILPELTWDAKPYRMRTLLKFRRLLEKNTLNEQLFAEVGCILQGSGMTLKTGTIVDVTLIAAPSSTKNVGKKRDPEMYQTRKGQQWYFGMNAHWRGQSKRPGAQRPRPATSPIVAPVRLAARSMRSSAAKTATSQR